ncbi:hypothetical protein ABZ354_06300 [Streptomyces sp. NPDC005925]|uniref:hypothetical protein n=1 Tax=Streptomyces sp. NPDC005925 TaxID=3157172 RepID=UPI00340C7F6C
MSQHGDARMPNQWAIKTLSSDVPPGWRAFAQALQGLCQHLSLDNSSGSTYTPFTQEKAARQLNTASSCLSRFLNAKTVPSLRITQHLYDVACAAAGGGDRVGISLEELTMMHSRAEAERRCANCKVRRGQTESLLPQFSEAAPPQRGDDGDEEGKDEDAEEVKVETLREEVAMLRAAMAGLKASRAGLPARLAARTPPPPPPVRRNKGDRRRMRNDTAAVHQLAIQAGQLQSSSPHGLAIKVLSQTTEALSPLETAGLLVLLRQQQQHELADNLLHVYGRDSEAEHVIHAALTLHEHGLPNDAGKLLRAAVG